MALKLSRKERTFIPTWEENDQLPEGEQIVVNHRLLTVEDMFAVQRATKVNLFAGLAPDEQDPEAMNKQWVLMKHVLTEYTSTWAGIEVDGEPLTTLDTVLPVLQAGHLPLLAEVFYQIINASSGSEEEAKNSDAGLEPVSTDSSTTAENADATDSTPNEIAAVST